jgi:hypothetical protein
MRTNQKILLLGATLVAAAALAWLYASGSSLRPRSRIFYKRYEPTRAVSQESGGVRPNGERLSQDAVQLALHTSGYANPDEIRPDTVKVKLFSTGEATATVIIRVEKLPDDSVDATETRVDLLKAAERWQVVWTGARWRCGRSFYSGWTIYPCP